MNNNQNTVEIHAELAEIFMKPATEIIEDRFSKDSLGADCSGRCESGGGCKAM